MREEEVTICGQRDEAHRGTLEEISLWLDDLECHLGKVYPKSIQQDRLLGPSHSARYLSYLGSR